MLCIFVLLLQVKLYTSQADIDNSSALLEFAASSNYSTSVVELTCNAKVVGLSNLTIAWYSSLLDDSLHEVPLVTDNQTLTFTTTPATTGQYYCALVLAGDTIMTSNEETVYVRDLVLKVEEAEVFKNEQVLLRVERHGDNSSLQCNTDPNFNDDDCPDKFTVNNDNYVSFLELCYSPTESFVVNCSATFSDKFVITQSLNVNVIAPAWSEWGDYSETCQISSEALSHCVKVRNRTCLHHNTFSTCEDGARYGFNYTACVPDDCEPVVTSWGAWNECTLNADRQCQKVRLRHCNSAVNSTLTECSESLSDVQDCEEEMCDRWTNWYEWTPCEGIDMLSANPQCQQSRRRECTLSPATCVGEWTQNINCSNTRECEPSFQSSDVRIVVIKRSYGEPFHVVCVVVPSTTLGFSGMQIQWYRDSELLVESKEFSEGTNKYRSEELTERNRGLYQCCVSNSFGKTCNKGWNVKLADYGPIEEKPNDAPYPIVLENNANYTLSCPLEGWDLEYQWYRGGEVGPGLLIPDSTSKWHNINYMSKTDEGRYTCCAIDTESGSGKHMCAKGYYISIMENVQRKYLIITISIIILLIVGLLFYIACAHTTKMNSFKRRFRHVFERSHTKLYNGLDPYGGGQVIQRSHSYIKRLSKSRPLSKSGLTSVIEQLALAPEPGEYPENAELGMEFDSIPNNCITINKTPVGTESKNRYLNVLPNQHSRVLLPELGKDPTSTYVNANYIRGYKLVPKEYVATQGPLPSTSCDFWRLIWEEKCRIIVMTTGLMENNRMKCSLYWPATEEGVTMKLGLFEIELAGLYPSKYYTLSIMKLRKLKEEDSEETVEEKDRVIYHMWYHSWPDFGVPEDTGPFLDFVECVRAFKAVLEDVPVCVHCSAGIGRTGTFVAVNLGIEQFRDNGKVDPLGYICQLRQDRGGMIQTLDQYTFVYRALHAYQLRLAARDKESKDRLHINFGVFSLSELDPLLPPNINLPVVTDLQGSSVEPNFIRNMTQAMAGTVSRYSDSITSINNLSIKASTDSLNKDSTKPLLSKSAKQKRRSKVKSLFFPLSPKDKLKAESASSHDLRNIEPAHRSLSLNNVRYSVLSKSRDSVASRDRVSVSSKGRSSLTSKDRVTVSSKDRVSLSKDRMSLSSASLSSHRDRVSISSNKSSNAEVSLKLEN